MWTAGLGPDTGTRGAATCTVTRQWSRVPSAHPRKPCLGELFEWGRLPNDTTEWGAAPGWLVSRALEE